MSQTRHRNLLIQLAPGRRVMLSLICGRHGDHHPVICQLGTAGNLIQLCARDLVLLSKFATRPVELPVI